MVITVSGNHETDVCFLYFGLDEIKLAHMTPGTWGYYFNIVATNVQKLKHAFSNHRAINRCKWSIFVLATYVYDCTCVCV